MANSVFSTTTDAPTVLKAGKGIVSVNGNEVIALNVQIQYQRQVEIVPVLGKKRVISIGEGQGTFTCDTLLANSVDAVGSFKLNGDDCKPFDMTIKFSGACDLASKTITCKNCFSSGITLTAQGGRGYVANGVQVTFSALEI